ncbi:hypothetical protein NIES806_28020 [Dolichospermum compactum NIES-806]|uniref:DUF1825 domain-containing protein n=2 Tax=Dolichospermum compactum TaxID=136073 RepID=A0A1Z4V534_9CYAN|nr:hypothetical protein NIES806_28020 [Dolichospermum compactum NIES-806]
MKSSSEIPVKTPNLTEVVSPDESSTLELRHRGKIRSYSSNSIQLKKSKMGFFDSEIVQHEAKELFEDYQALIQLGNSYGKFDREGKKLFIEQMESMMDRYRVFMKRFELSEDFMAQMTIQQLKTQLGQFGVTPQQMFEQMNVTLERMKAELEKTK